MSPHLRGELLHPGAQLRQREGLHRRLHHPHGQLLPRAPIAASAAGSLVSLHLDGRQRRRRVPGLDPVLRVEGLLHLAAARGLVEHLLHRLGDPIRVHDDPPLRVASGAAAGLEQTLSLAQEPLLVGVKNRHQAHLGEVEPLSQEVDPHEDVEDAVPQISQDLDTLEGVHVRV